MVTAYMSRAVPPMRNAETAVPRESRSSSVAADRPSRRPSSSDHQSTTLETRNPDLRYVRSAGDGSPGYRQGGTVICTLIGWKSGDTNLVRSSLANQRYSRQSEERNTTIGYNASLMLSGAGEACVAAT